MGCVFPFFWEETVSQFIPDSWKSLCNPGETPFKEFLLHGPGLPNAGVIDMSYHISVFPYDFDGYHLQKENLGRKRGEDWGRRWERGRKRWYMCILSSLSFHLSSPSPFLCLSHLLLEKSPNSKARVIYQEIQNPFSPIYLLASPLLAGPSLGPTVWWDNLFCVSNSLGVTYKDLFPFLHTGQKRAGASPRYRSGCNINFYEDLCVVWGR